MARPRSDDKRNAILAAAIRAIAEQGVSAPTATIARLAGVAEGSLFTYFANKDDLLNQLYLALKAELRDAMMLSYPHGETLRSRARHVWHRYVEWGVGQVDKRRAMAQLSVSERITAQSKAAGMAAFGDINAMVADSIAQGVLRDLPPDFVAAIMGALAETTMDFVGRDPAQAERYREAGFEAFWNAVTRA